MSENIKWNFEEFTAYLLLYASNADLDISPEEEDLIKKRLPEQSYQAVKDEFLKGNDYQHIQTILNYKGLYFPTEERARELMDLIMKQFHIDGHFSQLEKNHLKILKRLI